METIQAPSYLETAQEIAGFASLPEYEQANLALAEMIQDLGITMTATPIARREDRDDSEEGKKWNKNAAHAHCVIHFKNGATFATDYSAGIGAAFGKMTLAQFSKIAKLPGLFTESWAVENAWKHCKGQTRGGLLVAAEPFLNAAKMKWTPEILEVFASLLTDGTDDSFEDFCSNFGYEEDSRKAEKTWQLCCEIGRVLRRNIPREQLETMQQLAHMR